MKYLDGVPIARVHEREVSVALKARKTLRTSKTTAKVVHYDIRGFQRLRILDNPDIVASLHQGLGVKPSHYQEAWHGEAWWESITANRQDYPIRAQNGSESC